MQEVKKRGWVKNAAIIFLSVMLVLTFFSNTIMNRSLPEVAAERVQSGQLDVRIRGTGVVSANESYEVKSEQTRKVDSVPVKVGDTVEVGDTLLFFADAESEDIKLAQQELDELMLQYRLKLVDASNGEYEKENRAIENAQRELDEHKADMEKNNVTDEMISQAETRADNAEKAVKNQEDFIAKLEAASGGATVADLEKAQKDYDTVYLIYGTWYERLVEETNDWMERNEVTERDEQNAQRDVYMEALVERYKLLIAQAELESVSVRELTVETFSAESGENGEVTLFAKAIQPPRGINVDHMKKMVDAYAAVNPKKLALDAAKSASGLSEAKDKLIDLERYKSDCDEAVTELKEKQITYKTLKSGLAAKQDALEAAINALADAQKADQKEDIQLQADREKINEKKAELSALQGGGSGASVTSPVNGIVKSIEITAGNTASSNSTLMTIEVPDRGYGISFSVTTEQSKKVKVGDQAEVSGGYWGRQVTATLVGIKTDPQNPGTNKLLQFKLEGEVDSGSQLSVSIGERGGNYESIVPNSALRTDNNGDFVLVVVSKSSPLGNRYVAQRVDVKVQAKDDVRCAVSGGLSYSDMVITTSNKPLEPGMLVRLPD
ncbi:MAG: HlyD family efflux transporter periplasmic adaptor subunit [Oscillospiraceae bacterium]|nr:HlyD family efflux transporter periplasmic adaptor subunit [Oscillospiraceae bacterium]